ncbi:alpha/beta fold hydrolase [Herbiconiux sp. VKM Ac-2851]|uniref:alpha/beta fold hydrolase n=1 Tax=Herbiconiux sp. VKM Ac-2851 TaxID=2739025 RepID=UPI0015658980|nr:alpha/beta hydrolase [Herbiconiux sp. VKM Ac-2851]NQX35275.1 alpha/beta hydrolase [Herbiconiux sp. VKM Ac-2851]
MDLILIPGFWLNGDSWNDVEPGLRDAGFTVHTPTLAGLHSVDDDRSGVTLASQIAEVVALVDSVDASREIVLVGHSGGGSIIHAVVDARPERIRRAVYVDSWPTADGVAINEELEAVGDEVPLPGWGEFGEADLRGLTDDLRAWFRRIAIPQPVHVARDPQRLHDPRRYAVPVTLVASTFTREELDGYLAAGHPYFAELPHLESLTVVELPTGHWPQFTRPADLAAALAESARA